MAGGGLARSADAQFDPTREYDLRHHPSWRWRLSILSNFRRRILDGSADLSMHAGERSLDRNSGREHRNPERYVHRCFTSFGLAIHTYHGGLDLRPPLDFLDFAAQFIYFNLYPARASVLIFFISFS
jgi:hypothetical protein